MSRVNIANPNFIYDPEDPEGFRAGMYRLGPDMGAERTGATVYELPPGQALCPYHYESDEEWVIVLEGELSVRHPGGEDVLKAGDATAFPVGPDGAHQLINRSEEAVRYLMVSNRPSPEAVEYPDTRQVSVMAFTESQLGRPLWDIRTLAEE